MAEKYSVNLYLSFIDFFFLSECRLPFGKQRSLILIFGESSGTEISLEADKSVNDFLFVSKAFFMSCNT